MIFKNFRECRLVVLEWEKYFKENEWKKIYLAICHADISPIDDQKKCWLVQNAIINSLWDNEYAQSIGYKEWIIKQREDTLDMIDYYRENPEITERKE